MSPETRSRVMSRIRAGTPNQSGWVAKGLRDEGLEWEGHVGDLPGRPDFVFRRERVAVFVDGDFWHGWRFPTWRKKLSPNWEEKIEATKRRDQRNHRKLRRMGWIVVRVWEHQVYRDGPRCIARIVGHLSRSREGAPAGTASENFGGEI